MVLRLFPLRLRKFVRLTPEQAYGSIFLLMRENLGAENIEGEKEKIMFVKAKIGGALGAAVNVRVFPEGAVSTLDISFSYRAFLLVTIIVLVAIAGLSIIRRTAVPLAGTALILPLAYKANSSVSRFLNTVNEALPHLEREYARRALMEDRKRWRLEPKDTEELYKRLREKHIKTWGNTNVLDYKLADYERQGLTRNEAVRKTAEEEGIY